MSEVRRNRIEEIKDIIKKTPFNFENFLNSLLLDGDENSYTISTYRVVDFFKLVFLEGNGIFEFKLLNPKKIDKNVLSGFKNAFLEPKLELLCSQLDKTLNNRSSNDINFDETDKKELIEDCRRFYLPIWNVYIDYLDKRTNEEAEKEIKNNKAYEKWRMENKDILDR